MTFAGRLFAVAALAAAPFVSALGAAAFAQEMASPSGEVILSVNGAITATNGDGVAVFDLAMLEKLPQHEFKTTTIWTEGVVDFKGVLLTDLLAAVGATGTVLTATALNDYQIDIPISEITAEAPMLAYLANGEPMSVRDKGPLWVVYPYDQDEAYRTEQTYARSIWQVDRLAVSD